MKNLFKKLSVFVLILTISGAFALPKTAYALEEMPQEDQSEVTEIEYLLFSFLSYCDLTEFFGASVEKIAENTKILKDADRLYLENSFGKISTADVVNKYLDGWILDAVFNNKESGFFACAFKNDDKKQIVLAFRGTTDALGKDGINDAEFGLISVDAPQIADTLDLTKTYIAKNSQYAFSSTGHSLGGALATEIAQYYGWKGVTFNAAQMTGTLYYDNAEIFGSSYRGFELWNTVDHVNQYDFVVGTYEYGLFKNAIKHENKSKSDKFFAHSVSQMMTIDEENGTASLSAVIGKSYLGAQKEQIQIINSTGAVVLGNTKANLLTAQRIHSEFDVIYGGDGNDFIDSGDGNDTLIGSLGDDILDGGASNDTYLYYEGDGTDTVLDSGGHDKMLIFSDKEISTDENESYIFIYLGDRLIARLDKAARGDSYSGKPDGAKITDNYYTFTVTQIKSDGAEREYELKSQTPCAIEPVYKIAYAKSDAIKISENGGVKFDFGAQASEFSENGTSAYRFENGDKIPSCFIYTKNNNIKAQLSGDINYLDLMITRANGNDTVNVFLPKKSVKYNGESALDISSAPKIIFGGDTTEFSEIPYSDTPYLQLDKNILITRATGSRTLKATVLDNEIDSGEIKWSSTDEAVAQIDGGGNILVKETGQATVIAELNGRAALCRIFVIPDFYIFIMIFALLLIVCLIVILIKHIIKRRIRKRAEKKAANVKITA